MEVAEDICAKVGALYKKWGVHYTVPLGIFCASIPLMIPGIYCEGWDL
jgi:hypothetical protein